MIITDDFVMLNFPKTGSSFVRAMLKRVHGYDEGWINHVLHRAIRKFRYGTSPNRALRRLDALVNPHVTELIVPKGLASHVGYQQSQHGRYCQIPEPHKHKTIVTVARNPFSRYVSAYQFGFWRKWYPQVYSSQLREGIPNFPELSFREYYDMIHSYAEDLRLEGIVPKIELGVTAIQFIRFYFRRPDRVLAQIDDQYISTGAYREEMAPVVFLHQENLNEELYQFLLAMGYDEDRVRFIKDAGRVNVTDCATRQRRMDDFYSEKLVDTILRRDRLLFEVFPEYRP